MRHEVLTIPEPCRFQILTEHSQKAWDYLISVMEADDGCTLEQGRAEGYWVDGGTYEEGHVSLDDGGSIDTIELTEIQE